ncbi:hypothetical protein C1645_814393, partial [Glomus cerebriforme]
NPTDTPNQGNPANAPTQGNPTDIPKQVIGNPTDTPNPKNSTDTLNPVDIPKAVNPKDIPNPLDIPNGGKTPKQGNPADTPNPTDIPNPGKSIDIPSQVINTPNQGNSSQPTNSLNQGDSSQPTAINEPNFPEVTEPPTPVVSGTNIAPTAIITSEPNVNNSQEPVNETGNNQIAKGTDVVFPTSVGYPNSMPTNDAFIPPTSIVIPSNPPTPTSTSTTDSSSSPNVPEEIAVANEPIDEEEKLKNSDNETEIILKLNHINWEDVVNDPTLAAQIADFLPRDLANSLGLSESQIRTIKLERSPDNCVIIKLAIPKGSENNVVQTIKDPTSKFNTEGTKLNQFLDHNFIITNSSDLKESNDTSSPNKGATGSINKGDVIGFGVAGTTLLYAGLTALYIRSQRKKKTKQLQEQQEAYFSSSTIYTPVV